MEFTIVKMTPTFYDDNYNNEKSTKVISFFSIMFVNAFM